MGDLAEGLARVGGVLLALLPWAVWCAWWLCAVNWRKAWPMLAEGGWVPAVLLVVMAGASWAAVRR